MFFFLFCSSFSLFILWFAATTHTHLCSIKLDWHIMWLSDDHGLLCFYDGDDGFQSEEHVKNLNLLFCPVQTASYYSSLAFLPNLITSIKIIDIDLMRRSQFRMVLQFSCSPHGVSVDRCNCSEVSITCFNVRTFNTKKRWITLNI